MTESPVSREVDLDSEHIISTYVDDPRFLSRLWLANLIRQHLDDPSCRFVLLTGGPGTGKTSFIASLTTEFNSRSEISPLRYFIRKDSQEAWRSAYARDFLMAIGYQLAARRPELFGRLLARQKAAVVNRSGRLVGVEADAIIVSPFTTALVEQEIAELKGIVTGVKARVVVTDPPLDRLLNLALLAPAAVLAKHDPGARIVVLVDGVDEARWSGGINTIMDWLTSDCPALPSNVRMVIASRPDDKRLQPFRDKHRSQLRELRLEDERTEVDRDLRTYARCFVREPVVVAALADAQIAETDFVERAVNRAAGNFQYIASLFRGIDDAARSRQVMELRSLLHLDDIPLALDGLYAFFFQQLKERARRDVETGWVQISWQTECQSVLGVLAVAREPLTSAQISLFSGVSRSLHWILDLFTQFLDHRDDRYQFYHSTLAEFLTSERTRAEKPSEWLNPAEWNTAVGSRAAEAGGAWNENVDRYALAHAAGHLRAALEFGAEDNGIDTSRARLLLYSLARHESFLKAHAEAFAEHPELTMSVLQGAVEAAVSADDAPAAAEFLVRRALLRSAAIHENPLAALDGPGSLPRALELTDMLPPREATLWGVLLTWALAAKGCVTEAVELLERLGGDPDTPLLAYDADGPWLLAAIAPLLGDSFARPASHLFKDHLNELVEELILADYLGIARDLCEFMRAEERAGHAGILSRWNLSKAWSTLATALLQKERWDEAKTAFALAISGRDQDHKADLQRDAAAAWADAGRIDEALEAFQASQSDGRLYSSNGLRVEIAEAQAWTGDLTGAIETIRSSSVGEHGPGLVRLAEVELELGHQASCLRLLSEAESLVRAARPPGRQIRVQATIANMLAEIALVRQRAGDVSYAEALTGEARHLVLQMESRWARESVIAPIEAVLGNMAAAIEATAIDPDEHTRQQTIRHLYELGSASALRPIKLATRAGNLDKAAHLAEQIQHRGFKSEAIAYLCRQHCRRGESGVAFALAMRVEDPYPRFQVLFEVIYTARDASDTATAEAAIREASLAQPPPNVYWTHPNPDTALAHARGCAGYGETARAAFAETLLNRQGRLDAPRYVRAAIAFLLAKIGAAEGRSQRKASAYSLLEGAENELEGLEGSPASFAAEELAWAWITCDKFAEAVRAARLVPVPDRLNVLLSTAEMLWDAGQKPLARKVREEVASTIPTLPNARDRANATAALAYVDARWGDKKKVRRALIEIASRHWYYPPETMTNVLAELACCIAKNGKIAVALAVIDSAPEPAERPVYNSLWDKPAIDTEKVVRLLIDSLITDGRLDEARLLVTTRLSSGPARDDMLVEVGNEFAWNDDADSAIELAGHTKLGGARAEILAGIACAQARSGDFVGAQGAFQEAITTATRAQALARHDIEYDALTHIAILQARVGKLAEALKTIGLFGDPASGEPQRRKTFAALVAISTEISVFDEVGAAATLDTAADLCSSLSDLKEMAIAAAQANLPELSIKHARTIFSGPTAGLSTTSQVFADDSGMEIPDILDVLLRHSYVSEAKQVVVLCSSTIMDAVRGSLALSQIYPDSAHEIAEAVVDLLA